MSSTGKSKTELTRDWVTMMVYMEDRSLEELIRQGCKVMVFGWEYDDFVKILSKMEEDEIIGKDGLGTYSLTSKGLFNVKRNTIVPVLKAVSNNEYMAEFSAKNKENCDFQFLESLTGSGTDQQKEQRILNYGVANYDKLAVILNLILQNFVN